MKSTFRLAIVSSLIVAVTMLSAAIYSLNNVYLEAVARSRIDIEHRIQTFWEMGSGVTAAIFSVATVCAVLIVLLILAGRRATANQERSLAFLQQLIDSIPNPVFYKSFNGRYLGCNKAFEKFLGVPKSALLGKSVYDVAPPEIAEQYHVSDKKLLASPPGSIHTYESIVQDPEGISRDVIFYKARFIDNEGADIGIVGTILDITDRKRIEEKLRESEERYRTLFENAHDAIFTLRDTTVVDCNRQAICLFGAAAEQFVGHGIEEFSPELQPDGELSQAKARQKIEAALSGEPQSFEWLHTRPDGTSFYVDVSLNRLVIADEVLVQAIVRDATMRRQTEQMMIQSEKMLTVGGLAAGAAHELNNPLGAILQNAQNIIRRISPELEANERAADDIGIKLSDIQAYMERRGITEMLRHIDSSVNRAADIVANLLTMSQKSPARVDRVLLPEIIDRAVALATTDYDLKKKFGFRDIVIVRDYAADLPEISADARDIQQVIFNLLKNAAQACSGIDDGRKPTITIRTGRQGKYASLEIEDNGTGIPEELLPRIFEPFFTTRGVGGGTGLGLSVAYALIVNNHKGRISAESKPGKGSCFRILLPFDQSNTR